MAKQTISLGTPPSGTDGDTNRTAFEKCNANFTELYEGRGGLVFGLTLEWLSGTSLRVTSGGAFIQSLGYAVDVPAAITKAGLALAASTWYHVYLFLNSGAPDIEVVTTAPAAPYSGSSRSKTGDTSRRYLGSVKTAAAGGMFRFDHFATEGTINYKLNINTAPLHPLAFGAATTATVVDLSGSIPVSGRRALLYMENSAASLTAYVATPDMNPITDVIFFLRAGSKLCGNCIVSSAQTINYQMQSAPGAGTGLDIWVLGYQFER